MINITEGPFHTQLNSICDAGSKRTTAKINKLVKARITSTTGFATTSYTRFCDENSVKTSSNS